MNHVDNVSFHTVAPESNSWACLTRWVILFFFFMWTEASLSAGICFGEASFASVSPSLPFPPEWLYGVYQEVENTRFLLLRFLVPHSVKHRGQPGCEHASLQRPLSRDELKARALIPYQRSMSEIQNNRQRWASPASDRYAGVPLCRRLDYKEIILLQREKKKIFIFLFCSRLHLFSGESCFFASGESFIPRSLVQIHHCFHPLQHCEPKWLLIGCDIYLALAGGGGNPHKGARAYTEFFTAMSKMAKIPSSCFCSSSSVALKRRRRRGEETLGLFLLHFLAACWVSVCSFDIHD